MRIILFVPKPHNCIIIYPNSFEQGLVISLTAFHAALFKIRFP